MWALLTTSALTQNLGQMSQYGDNLNINVCHYPCKQQLFLIHIYANSYFENPGKNVTMTHNSMAMPLLGLKDLQPELQFFHFN